LLAIWIAFACLYAVSPLDERQVYFGGDQAQLLRSADDTLRGSPPLAGAPSRGGVSHPGPLFVFVLAALQAVTGHREAYVVAAISFLQAGTVALLGALAYRLTRSLLLAALLPFLFVLEYHFILYMRWLWNVSIVTPALALALWIAVSARTRPKWRLALLAATLSLIAQAHMGFLPVAVWLGAATLGLGVSSRDGWSRRHVIAAGLTLLLCWVPVMWDAVLQHGGNAAKLFARFTTRHEPHPAAEVLTVLDSVVQETLPWRPGVRHLILAGSFCLIAAAATGRRERAASFRWLLVLLGGTWLTIFWSVRAIPEPIQRYYLRPLCVLIAATVIGAVAALDSFVKEGVPRRLVRGTIACAVVALSAGPAIEMRRRFADPRWNTLPLSEIRSVVDTIASRSDPKASPARIEFRLGDLEGVEPSFVYLLERRGIHVSGSPTAPRFRISATSSASSAPVLLTTERYRVEEPR
jgi:hypothetical protein